MITVIILYYLEVKSAGTNIAYYGCMWVACPFAAPNGQIDKTDSTYTWPGLYCLPYRVL